MFENFLIDLMQFLCNSNRMQISTPAPLPPSWSQIGAAYGISGTGARLLAIKAGITRDEFSEPQTVAAKVLAVSKNHTRLVEQLSSPQGLQTIRRKIKTITQ